MRGNVAAAGARGRPSRPRSRTIGRRTSRPTARPSEAHRVGRRIRAREVRVIDQHGEQRGIMSTQDALELANEGGLQLVEVNPKANPPVCKIMDYGKFKYESAKRDREAKRNQTTSELKEVKFRPKTHGHDFDFKLRHVRRFLSEGDKVKLVVQFRGREVTHPETGHSILERVCKESADLSTVIQVARMEGNRMNMVIAPKPGREPPKPRPARPASTGKPKEEGDELADAPAEAPRAATPPADAAAVD